MKTIFEKITLAGLILQEQKIVKDQKYRLQSFCLVKTFGNDKVIYNNLTKKMVLLSNEEAREIEKLPCNANDILLPLIKDWFLVTCDNDDCKLSDQIYETSKMYVRDDYLSNFVILTTTDCNARCHYCYEHGVTRRNMSKKTALDVAEYIINTSKGNPVSIKWFGGEPLYNSEVIDIICRKLADNNIDFKSRMTTNGYLFDEELVKKAKSFWRISNVQVTLDGTEEVYNKTKAYIYKDGGSPFVRVTDNIDKLLKSGIKVEIRMNVSDKNRNNIYQLIDYIDKRYPDKTGIILYAANLFDLDNTRTDRENIRLISEYFKIDEYISRKGFSNTASFQRLLSLDRGCMAQNKRSVIISPQGLLGNCEHFSEGEKLFGSIYNSDINYMSIEYWNEFKKLPACKDCIAYPNCGGKTNCPNLSKKCETAEKLVKTYNIEKNVADKYFKYIGV